MKARNDVLTPLFIVANKIDNYALMNLKTRWSAIDIFRK